MNSVQRLAPNWCVWLVALLPLWQVNIQGTSLIYAHVFRPSLAEFEIQVISGTYLMVLNSTTETEHRLKNSGSQIVASKVKLIRKSYCIIFPSRNGFQVEGLPSSTDTTFQWFIVFSQLFSIISQKFKINNFQPIELELLACETGKLYCVTLLSWINYWKKNM